MRKRLTAALAPLAVLLALSAVSSTSLAGAAIPPYKEKQPPHVTHVVPPCPVWQGLMPFTPAVSGLPHRIEARVDCSYRLPLRPAALYPQLAVVQPWGCRNWCINYGKTYVVKPGDNLWDLLVRWGYDPTMWQYYAQGNSITDPYKMRVGKVLLLP